MMGIWSTFTASWLACALALSLAAPLLPQPQPSLVRTQQRQTQAATGAPVLNRRLYTLDNTDNVCMGRLETTAPGDGATEVERFTIQTAAATISFYDPKLEQWVHTPLAQGRYDPGLLQLRFDGEEHLIYLPKTYRSLVNGGKEYLPKQDGYLQTTKTTGGWSLSIYAKAPAAGCVADYVCVRSQSPLLDWSMENTGNLWKSYTMAGDKGKWCYDGYYWPAASTYIPSGENVYFRSPAAYLVKSFAYIAKSHRAAEAMGRCMLDTLTLYQSPDGCWLTPAQSTWLSGDYGIGAGFYDTRFNTDLVQIMVYSYARYPDESVRKSMEAYADFYVQFAADHHTETTWGGWLVEDYWSPGGNRKTHTSLNHLVAECDLLYRLSETLDRPDLEALAHKLLAGIRDTAKRWIRSDGNLHYAVYANGSFGGTDYPNLTYNDLFTLQALLKAQGRPEEPALSQLMTAKKAWMDKTGVQGYLR